MRNASMGKAFAPWCIARSIVTLGDPVSCLADGFLEAIIVIEQDGQGHARLQSLERRPMEGVFAFRHRNEEDVYRSAENATQGVHVLFQRQRQGPGAIPEPSELVQ